MLLFQPSTVSQRIGSDQTHGLALHVTQMQSQTHIAHSAKLLELMVAARSPMRCAASIWLRISASSGEISKPGRFLLRAAAWRQ